MTLSNRVIIDASAALLERPGRARVAAPRDRGEPRHDDPGRGRPAGEDRLRRHYRPVRVGRRQRKPAGSRQEYRPRSLGRPWRRCFAPPRRCRTGRRPNSSARDIATPRPLLACRPRGWTTLGTILATQWIGGGENLHLFGWRIAARPLARAASHRRTLCRRRWGDCSDGCMRPARPSRPQGRQLLAIEEGSEVVVYLVDLDGLQAGGRLISSGGPATWRGSPRDWPRTVGSRVRSAGVFSAHTSGSRPGEHRLETALAGNRQGNARTTSAASKRRGEKVL